MNVEYVSLFALATNFKIYLRFILAFISEIPTFYTVRFLVRWQNVYYFTLTRAWLASPCFHCHLISCHMWCDMHSVPPFSFPTSLHTLRVCKCGCLPTHICTLENLKCVVFVFSSLFLHTIIPIWSLSCRCQFCVCVPHLHSSYELIKISATVTLFLWI